MVLFNPWHLEVMTEYDSWFEVVGIPLVDHRMD